MQLAEAGMRQWRPSAKVNKHKEASEWHKYLQEKDLDLGIFG
jgi:hypothetical protein